MQVLGSSFKKLEKIGHSFGILDFSIYTNKHIQAPFALHCSWNMNISSYTGKNQHNWSSIEYYCALALSLRYKGTANTVIIVWRMLNWKQCRVFISIYQILIKLCHCSIILILPIPLFQTLETQNQVKIRPDRLNARCNNSLFF